MISCAAERRVLMQASVSSAATLRRAVARGSLIINNYNYNYNNNNNNNNSNNSRNSNTNND